MASQGEIIKNRQGGKASLAQRQREIVAVAGRLFMEKGYYATSMRELARTLNLDAGSLYRYVPSKDALLALMAQEVTETVARALKDIIDTAPPAEALRLAFTEYVRLVDRHKEYYQLFYRCFDVLSRDHRAMLLDGEHALVHGFQHLLERQGYEPGDARSLAWDLTVLGEMWAVKSWAFGPFMSLDEYVANQWRVANAALQAFRNGHAEANDA